MPREERTYYVYIMTNIARTLYVGMTNSLIRRVLQHKQKTTPGFTSKYGLTRLVYFEQYDDVFAAIGREKQIKGWLRAKKLALIEEMNPEWRDLSAEWHEGVSIHDSHRPVPESAQANE